MQFFMNIYSKSYTVLWSFSLHHDIWHWVALKGQIKVIWCSLGCISYSVYYWTAELSGREASCWAYWCTVYTWLSFNRGRVVIYNLQSYIPVPGGGGGGTLNIYWWGCATTHPKRGVLSTGTTQKGGS